VSGVLDLQPLAVRLSEGLVIGYFSDDRSNVPAEGSLKVLERRASVLDSVVEQSGHQNDRIVFFALV
jgi:hypothetical protein